MSGGEQYGEYDLIADLRRLSADGLCLCSSAHTDWRGVEALLDRLEFAEAQVEAVRAEIRHLNVDAEFLVPKRILGDRLNRALGRPLSPGSEVSDE